MTNTENTTAPFIVCPECEGLGKFGPGIVSTSDDFDEDPEGTRDLHRSIATGMWDVPCETCKGQRVVRAWRMLDGERLTAEDEWRYECEYRAEVAAERRMGC